MKFKILSLFLLLVAGIAQVGCASAGESSDNVAVPDLEPVPSHDDSHGWGANLQGGSH